MRTTVLGFIMLALVGCLAKPAAGAQYSDAQQECMTTRDVEKIVTSLRDEGWSTTRTIGAILEVAQVDDEETNEWFVELVNRVYGSTVTSEQIEAKFVQCMQAIPPLAKYVLSTNRPAAASAADKMAGVSGSRGLP